ncbi:hypothetical protein [Spirulina sp. 06S082]|uniref:hypothetical protein n=1 Tax=Spirulina sp. 06S082 TaxID=3110248 RepID=UPI002B21BBEB|nr:hypothetical protein [Spirulina sp. 06S082]MEA5471032.1 hypothetical protein [Spirulina sp. 06S082]
MKFDYKAPRANFGFLLQPVFPTVTNNRYFLKFSWQRDRSSGIIGSRFVSLDNIAGFTRR